MVPGGERGAAAVDDAVHLIGGHTYDNTYDGHTYIHTTGIGSACEYSVWFAAAVDDAVHLIAGAIHIRQRYSMRV